MIEFTLPIIPTAQARPKVTVRGKFAHAYKSSGQKANERTLEAWLAMYAPESPMEGPLALDVVAALPVGKSDSKKAVAAKLAGEIAPTKKPDLDNILKNLKDACTRMQFWHDDSQVVCIRAEKIYSETGYWRVAISRHGISG